MNIVNNLVKILDGYLDHETVNYFNNNMLLNEDVAKINSLLSQVENKQQTYNEALQIACNRYRTYSKV